MKSILTLLVLITPAFALEVGDSVHNPHWRQWFLEVAEIVETKTAGGWTLHQVNFTEQYRQGFVRESPDGDAVWIMQSLSREPDSEFGGTTRYNKFMVTEAGTAIVQLRSGNGEFGHSTSVSWISPGGNRDAHGAYGFLVGIRGTNVVIQPAAGPERIYDIATGKWIRPLSLAVISVEREPDWKVPGHRKAFHDVTLEATGNSGLILWFKSRDGKVWEQMDQPSSSFRIKHRTQATCYLYRVRYK